MAIKLINMGESGAGKSGAIASLCAAGYNVRVLDLEDGVEATIALLQDPAKYPPDAISRFRWKTITEPMMVRDGRIEPRQAIVYAQSVQMLDKWAGDSRFDMTTGEIVPCTDSLGTPYNWTSKDVLVLDTLTKFGQGAVNYHLQLQGKLGAARTSMEGMKDAGTAQSYIERFLAFMGDKALPCNVIINTHINWAKEDGSNPELNFEGMRYGFPSSLGKALNNRVAQNLNHLLLTRRVGTEQRIYTRDIANVALKTGAPGKVKASYPLASGLADYFADVLAKPKAQGPTK